MSSEQLSKYTRNLCGKGDDFLPFPNCLFPEIKIIAMQWPNCVCFVRLFYICISSYLLHEITLGYRINEKMPLKYVI